MINRTLGVIREAWPKFIQNLDVIGKTYFEFIRNLGLCSVIFLTARFVLANPKDPSSIGLVIEQVAGWSIAVLGMLSLLLEVLRRFANLESFIVLEKLKNPNGIIARASKNYPSNQAPTLRHKVVSLISFLIVFGLFAFVCWALAEYFFALLRLRANCG